jgi:UDP-2,4-diacetamido-2,4,6-trideoxy-beta-L-altropyranose hydrolase
MITLLIRTDATPQTGAGHFMRCLALAHAWRERGGRVIFVVSRDSVIPFPKIIPPDLEIKKNSAPRGSREDAEQTKKLAEKNHSSWIILDGYHFDSAFQKVIKDSKNRLLVIDDYAHADFYYADIVLNQNAYALPDLYERKQEGARLLIGSRYVLLRPEFRKWRTWQRIVPDMVKKILVTLGGSDQCHVTLTVLRSLQCIDDPDLEVRVVTGFHNPDRQQLEEERKNCRFNLTFIDNASDMAELIAWADVGISAAGSTSWELAFLGLPTLLVTLSENQVPVAQVLHETRVSQNLGSFESVSIDHIQKNFLELMHSRKLREEFSRNGRRLVDGFGPERVIMEMTDSVLRFQPITEDDCMMVYAWVTDPEVRKNSFSNHDISLEEHKRWFYERLSDSSCEYNIIINRDDIPVGQVRFDISNSDAIISILIAQEFRGHKIGQHAISLASELLFRIRPVNNIHAYIKTGNSRSLNAFKKSGYQLSEEIMKNSQMAYHLVLTR